MASSATLCLTLDGLPPHVLATVLRNVSVRTLVRVAHLCRSLHKRMTASATCVCDGPLVAETARLPFWAHWRAQRPRRGRNRIKVRVRNVVELTFALHAGLDLSGYHQWALGQAVKEGLVAHVDALLRDPRIDVSVRRQYALRAACEYGRTEVVARLLRDPRIDITARGNAALAIATRMGHGDIVRHLVNHPRFDVAACNHMTLRWACRRGDEHLVAWLLAQRRVRPHVRNQEAMIGASSRGHVAVVRLLLGNPRVSADVGFFHACWNGRTEVVDLFLRRARVNLRLVQNEAHRWDFAKFMSTLQLHNHRALDFVHDPVLMAAVLGHWPLVQRLLRDEPMAHVQSTHERMRQLASAGNRCAAWRLRWLATRVQETRAAVPAAGTA